MNIIDHLRTVLMVAAAGALIAVAQMFVRERSADAALRLSIAGGLVLLVPLSHYVPLGPLHLAFPLFTVGAAGCAVWALFLLADALHPKQQGAKLPPSVESLRHSGEGSGIGARIMWAVFGLVAVGASGRFFDGGSIAAGGLAVVIAALAPHLLHQRGSWAVWVLDRHPEWIVWIYPSKLTVVSQRYGTRTVYWRAILGMLNGGRLTLPSSSEQGAAQVAAEVASLCPGASLGHTPELEAKFRMSPESMLRGSSGGPQTI